MRVVDLDYVEAAGDGAFDRCDEGGFQGIDVGFAVGVGCGVAVVVGWEGSVGSLV